ncbi:hypothetical protein [Rhodococcus jostii]|uniref:hypothetical protein n=1 Tax=Rhodococcus jostii TaxID=132919 RepID=UPI003637CB06
MTITHHVPRPAEFGSGDVTTCGLSVTMRVNFSVTGKYVNCPDCFAHIEAENRALVATIDRVNDVLAEYLDPEDVDIECREDMWRFIRDLRAALEGGIS